MFKLSQNEINKINHYTLQFDQKEFFSWLPIVRQFTFTHKVSNVVPHRSFILLAFIAFLKQFEILLKPFILLVQVIAHVILELIDMRVQNMEL